MLPENFDALLEGILGLTRLSPGEQSAMGERGRRFVEAHHMVDRLAQRFLDFAYPQQKNR